MKLTTHMAVVLRLRINVALFLLPHIPFWCAKGQYYLLLHDECTLAYVCGEE